MLDIGTKQILKFDKSYDEEPQFTDLNAMYEGVTEGQDDIPTARRFV